MSKYVLDTAPAKALSAYVIMKGRRHVATVRVHHGARCLVNVHQDNDAHERCKSKGGACYDASAYGFQYGTASGYDKFTAALSGLWIDGHRMADHGEPGKVPPKGETVFPRDYLPPKGYSLTNWSSELGGFLTCYKLPGLYYLRDLGYTVVQAI